MGLDRFPLRAKILVPIVLLALTALGISAFGAARLVSVSTSAREIIEHRDVGVINVVRATRRMTMMVNAVFGALDYEGDLDEGQAAAADFPATGNDVNELLDRAAAAIPEKADQIHGFKSRFADIFEKAKPPFERGQKTSRIYNLIKITPIDLQEMSDGDKQVGAISADVRALLGDIKAFNDNLIAENADMAQELEHQSWNALIAIAAVGTLSTLAAVAFAVWVSSSKIARPLGRMAARMKRLAEGDHAVEFEGGERHDEIGVMANALQVFRDHMIARERAEKGAADHRNEVEAERERAVAETARAAAVQDAAMHALGDGLQRLAAGDLTARLDSGFPAQFAKIREDFNDASGKLMETLRAVVASAGAIQNGAREITSASDDLSSRTEQQAASLEQTAAALDEITATLNRSAEGAKHARDVVKSADENAKQGAVIAKKAVEAMGAISKSSDQIGRIISVIDEIAFQTNLLALNAGVEAARAGDAGKGFAVVASEVRALAQRSAEAAKEIKALVSASATQVGAGVKLVADTGTALERIISQVSEINTVVTAIAAGAQEEASGLSQVNTAINHMDQTTQQNATMVEESTATSHSLSHETAQLAKLVDQFRVGEATAAAKRRDPQQAAASAAAQARAGGRKAA